MNKNIFIAICLSCAFLLSIVMTPTLKEADSRETTNLETIIPTQFGDWVLDEKPSVVLINPALQATLNVIYNQTLNRTYINAEGKKLMLSIAYGGDQSDSLQVHRPETCYPAQGMPIIDKRDDALTVSHGTLPVRRLVSKRSTRLEPITYWIRMGDKAVIGTVEQKLAKMAYTLTGEIPDGLLFRTSTIGLHEEESFRLQDDFINALIDSLDAKSVSFIAGDFS